MSATSRRRSSSIAFRLVQTGQQEQQASAWRLDFAAFSNGGRQAVHGLALQVLVGVQILAGGVDVGWPRGFCTVTMSPAKKPLGGMASEGLLSVADSAKILLKLRLLLVPRGSRQAPT
jgi:hypothetical protein